MPYMENRLDIISVRTLLRAWGDNSRGGRLKSLPEGPEVASREAGRSLSPRSLETGLCDVKEGVLRRVGYGVC